MALAAALSGATPSIEEIRAFGARLGIFAPLLYVLVIAVLNSMFVVVPVLAGAAGLIFGTALGTPVAVAGLVAAACLQMTLTRRITGADGAPGWSGRAQRLDAFLERRGAWAVLYLRLTPIMPYAPTNYAAGLTSLRLRSMAAGTAIGMAPRTFAYVALGGNIDDLGAPEVKVAVALIVAMAVGGLIAARRSGASDPIVRN